MISIGTTSLYRKVINTFTGTAADSWDEAVGGGEYNTLGSGDFYYGGKNAFAISGNN